MNRAEIVTTVVVGLMGTPQYQGTLDNEALVNDAAVIADLIMDEEKDYEAKIVTKDDEDLINQINERKKGNTDYEDETDQSPIIPRPRRIDSGNGFIEEQ